MGGRIPTRAFNRELVPLATWNQTGMLTVALLKLNLVNLYSGSLYRDPGFKKAFRLILAAF